jgi:hypothetical protein
MGADCQPYSMIRINILYHNLKYEKRKFVNNTKRCPTVFSIVEEVAQHIVYIVLLW